MRSVPVDKKLRVDPDHQDFLVVRAVEYPDPPTLGKCLAVPPKELVLELLGGRLLEGHHLASLRVHPRHDVLDDPVLAGGVHALKDDQQGIAVARPEEPLRRHQLVDEGPQVLPSRLLAVLVAVP